MGIVTRCISQAPSLSLPRTLSQAPSPKPWPAPPPLQDIVTQRVYGQYNTFLTPLQLTLRTMALPNVQQLPPIHAPVRPRGADRHAAPALVCACAASGARKGCCCAECVMHSGQVDDYPSWVTEVIRGQSYATSS